MKARNKKSKNAAYKNRKSKEGGGWSEDDGLSGIVEKKVVTAVRREIRMGKEDLFKDAYGLAGLEEYLVGGQFELLLDEKYYEVGRKYYLKSCEKDHPLGQFAAALMYLQGSLGHSVDEVLGVEIMSRAAKAGCGPALYNKGRWLMEGTFGQQKDAKKADKMFHRAIKDPLLKKFPQQHAESLVCLGQLRMSGDGCNKSYSASLRHFRAAQEIKPNNSLKKTIKQLELLEVVGGVELQREADVRNRRLKVLKRVIQYQTLGEWVELFKHCGFEFSVQPGVEEAAVSLDRDGVIEWMERVGAIQTLPEDYPGMHDPLPPLECERPGCGVTEDTSGEKMKKCTECQAPYCGVACQRKDWARHKPVCEAVQGSMEAELTNHDMEFLKKDTNIAEKLSKMGLSMEDFDEASSDLKTCGHVDSSIPCSSECFQERGAGSMKKHGYFMVGQSDFTERQKQTARDLGYELPEELSGQVVTGPRRAEETNSAAEVVDVETSGRNNGKALKKQLAMLEENPDMTYCLFTPSNEAANHGIKLNHVMGKIMFKLMWNRLIAVPWGPAARSRPLWVVYEMLVTNQPNKYKAMLRNQLMAEFGVDPFECKNAEMEEFEEGELRAQMSSM